MQHNYKSSHELAIEYVTAKTREMFLREEKTQENKVSTLASMFNKHVSGQASNTEEAALGVYKNIVEGILMGVGLAKMNPDEIIREALSQAEQLLVQDNLDTVEDARLKAEENIPH